METGPEETSARPASRRSSPRAWAVRTTPLLLAALLQWLASVHPDVTERLYSRGVYPCVQRVLSGVNSMVSFSIFEMATGVLGLAVLAGLGWGVARALREGVGRVLAGAAWHGVWVGGFLALAFLLSWGFNYQRMDVSDNLSLRKREPGPDDRYRLARYAVEQINRAYDASRPPLDTPSASPSEASVLAAVDEAWGYVEASEAGKFLAARGPCRPKALFCSDLMSLLGLSGVFNPFTGEANFNREPPLFDLPFSVAHEEAHLKGIARESEANFMAFLVCTQSKDAFVRYSGWLGTIGLVASLRRTHLQRYRALLREMGPGPRGDLRTRMAFWRSREGVLTSVGRTVNDLYLKTNRIRTGLHNYNEADALVVEYLETREPRAWKGLPLPEDPAR